MDWSGRNPTSSDQSNAPSTAVSELPAKLCGKENEGKENTNKNLKLLIFLSLIFLSD
jgi:hypothetical protein